ncbi:molybdopterin-dependent oxidoreductase [Desulfotomaculum defluvii]
MQIKTNCPLDCFAHCGLVASVENGKIVNISGDENHPVNKGLICSKGRHKHLQRLYSPERITTPLRKTDGGWQPITWENAYEIISTEVTKIINSYGPLALLHHDSGGSEGILKTLSQRFFNALGGCTQPAGSICWGSGHQAQKYDFGHLQLHSWEDMVHSRLILLWGRDPAATNIQMLPLLKEAKRNGCRIVVINPIKVASCALADFHIAPRPGTDGALALALAREIINNHWVDQEYIHKHVYGYGKFSQMVQNYTPELVATITGVEAETIRQLAQMYATTKPASIFFGYGLQRYTNGGQTIRSIDALAAITGNIGKSGGGANYAGGHWKGFFNSISGNELPHRSRSLPWPILGKALSEADSPPVKGIFVTRSNPLTQLPDITEVRKAFSQSRFTVVVDMFLTDTAQYSNLFLPCTTFLEEEDVIYSSWNHYLSYSPQIIEPLGQCRSDHHIFSRLAQYMGLAGFPNLTAEQWLKKSLSPLGEFGITLEKLKDGPVRHPLSPDVPWQGGGFSTPSGKFELYSQLAAADGVNPLPEYVENTESPLNDPNLAKVYPFHLITAHHPEYLHSQFWNLSEKSKLIQPVYLHPETAGLLGIKESQKVTVATQRGQAKFTTVLSNKLRRDTVLIYQGFWSSHGNNVNTLTPQYIPDMGLGTPYYDCLCRIDPC